MNEEMLTVFQETVEFPKDPIILCKYTTQFLRLSEVCMKEEMITFTVRYVYDYCTDPKMSVCHGI